MGTFVKRFLEYEKKLKSKYKHLGLTITVSGLSSSGKTTGAKVIAKHFGLKYHSSGTIFREVAKKMAIPLEKFSEIRSDEIDLKIDEETLKLAIIGNVVLDGRLTGWVAGEWAEVRIFYNTPLKIRARRYAEREGIDYKTALTNVKKRDEADMKKYKKLYGINLKDLSIYNIIIDNSNWSLEDANKKPIKIIEEFLKRRKNENNTNSF
jgi:cytidylate kinase